MKIKTSLIALLISLASCQQPSKQEENQKPNIVLIVADDLGFGDIGCYGGDIETPNIDALAKRGIRFSQFTTAPMCAPTRAMLLTGNDNHIAGMGIQGIVRDTFGYEGHLTNRVVTIPQLLRDAGYHTYMAGKWHLGLKPEDNPHQKGFEHSYVLLPGAGNHYSNQSALSAGLSTYTEDGEAVKWPDGKYSTDFYTDKLIEYIGSNEEDDKPFFAFAAYTSPHWPLQVDKKYWKKYEGRYDEGYEQLRKSRLQSLKKAGIIPEDAVLPEIHPRFAKLITPWDSLSPSAQKKEARKMELYAGMVDNLDHNIGRLIAYLKEVGKFENTLFVFMSDNGAGHRDFYNRGGLAKVLQEYYNEEYEHMGQENSYVSYGPQWAEAGSAPFRYFKDFTTQGGINTTMIITGPGVNRKGELHHDFLTLQDLAPTFYEIAGVTYPETYNGHPVYPLRGASVVPFISGHSDHIHDENYVFAMEHINNAMVRKGNWKLVNSIRPLDTINFELFDLSKDMEEQKNLKAEHPEKYRELINEWTRYAEEVRVQVLPTGN